MKQAKKKHWLFVFGRKMNEKQSLSASVLFSISFIYSVARIFSIHFDIFFNEKGERERIDVYHHFVSYF